MMKKKRIKFIAQTKGGVGKSVLAYVLANVYVMEDTTDGVLFIDMDNQTKTSLKQLQFVNSRDHNLINEETRQLDRSLLDRFFEAFAEQNKYHTAICDMGGTTSEQFLQFLNDEDSDEILEIILEDIEIEVLCIIAGDNSFTQTASFCKTLFDKLHGKAKLHILKNRLFAYNDEMNQDIEEIADYYDASVNTFSLLSSPSPSAMKEIQDLMGSGKPAILDASRLTRARFKKSLNNFVYKD